MKTKFKIKITGCKPTLTEFGGEEFADKHAGKEYNAIIAPGGWASVGKVGFAADLYITLAKFKLGRTVATQGAVALGTELLPFFVRHSRGDWGTICKEDAEQNELGLKHNERLMSVYQTPNGDTLWIITEWDRSVTTALLPDEY